jgi:hypothetical protein
MRRGHAGPLLPYPRVALVGSGMLFALFWGAEAYMAHLSRALHVRGAAPPEHRTSLVVLCALAALLGAFRLMGYHPLTRKGYAEWLATSPWRVPDPLPLGPVHLVWGDLFVLVPMALLARFACDGDPLLPLRFFLGAYVVAATVTSIPSPAWVYALLLAFAGVVRLSPHPGWQAAWLVGTYAVALAGVRATLRRLPMRPPPRAGDVPLGWPFAALAPVPPRTVPGVAPVTPMVFAAGAALLAGAWAYAAAAITPLADVERTWATWVLGVGVLAGLVRVLTYWSAVGAPLGIRGRLASGRWWVGGYDRMYAAPLAAVVAAAVLPAALRHAPLSPAVAAAACVGAAVFLVLAPGPRLAAWRLTSPGRLSFAPMDGAKYARLT